MSDDKGGANTGADNQGNVDGNGETNERAKWTPEQWETWAAREADRRVSDAQKKWRGDLTAQLTAKDQDAETRVQTALQQAQQAETRAAFAERATTVGIADVRAAWAVVKEYGLANDKGEVDFDKMKDAHPSLFAAQPRKTTPAGRTPDTGGKNKLSMTDILRKEYQER